MDQSAFLEALAALQEPHPAEFWYWWSQIILTGLVFVSAVVAACQLILIRRQARANFLLELDRRWEADDLWKTRVTIQESKNLYQTGHSAKPRQCVATSATRALPRTVCGSPGDVETGKI